MRQFEKFKKWRQNNLKKGCGIIVAADQTQEWILPWWWQNYARHNSYPVSFVDFGLTEKMKQWCREKGEFIPLPVPDVFVKERDEIDPRLIEDWENNSGTHFWEGRNSWFKKPLVCLLSPYEKTVYSDLDCEIRGSLAPLFEFLPHPSGLAMAKKNYLDGNAHPIQYSAGLILFQRNLPLFEEWANAAFEKNGLFRDDQELLVHLIAEKNLLIAQLPPLYNWGRCQGDQPEALITHWHGKIGKQVIALQIRKAEEENFDTSGNVRSAQEP